MKKVKYDEFGNMGENYCLDCGKKMEIQTDIQLCQKCMQNYDTDLLWQRHDNNEIDALDFNEDIRIRDQYRIN